MTAVEQLTQTLRKNGVRATKPRAAVFTALLDQEPLTMHELLGRCSSLDRASVYRTVALFETLSIVQRLQTGWKYKLELSGAFHQHHHHATCLRCGTTIPLPEHPTLEKLLHDISTQADFTLTIHQIELQGYCANCAADSAPASLSI